MKNLGFGTMMLQLSCGDGSIKPDQQQVNDIEPQIDGIKQINKIGQTQINEMVDLFLDRGFRYFDTAHGPNQVEIETILSRALIFRHPRNRFYLADHMPSECINSNLDYEPFFQTQLERWNVDYFDFYSLNPINPLTYTDAVEYDGFEFLSCLKEEGRAKHIGFFFDGKPELLDAILSDHPEMDFVQMNLNYQDWYDDRHPCRSRYETALKYRKPVIAADPLKGGALSHPPASVQQALRQCHPDWTPQIWALRFAASLHHIPVVLSPASSPLELEIHLKAISEGTLLTEKEQHILKNLVEPKK